MSRLTGQPWLAVAATIDDGWSRSGRIFWRKVESSVGDDAKEPNRLHDAVLRAYTRAGWAICQRRGHLFAGEWRYSLRGHKAHRFCVRCLDARQEGIFETEPTVQGQSRITRVTPV